MRDLASLQGKIDLARKHAPVLVAEYEADLAKATRDNAREERRVALLPPPRPFLKWVGGKGRQLDALRRLRPKKFGRYFEPFLGGGAMFWDLAPADAWLNDLNVELIDTYCGVRNDVERVIRMLRHHRRRHMSHRPGVRAEHYDRYRRLKRDWQGAEWAAARLIYLNKTCFNGLYRVNARGEYNAPLGRYDNPLICDAPLLRACSRVLARPDIQVESGDYRRVLRLAERGDFVYFDPPYVPVNATASFTAYTAGGFGEKEHRELAEVFQELADDGVKVMLSNSDTPLVRELYADYPIKKLWRAGTVSSDPKGRGRVREVVVRSDVW